ncbi:BLUF domain-containing protein [Endozoicomonas atrinae]|uniref:BLUF domain-containing protein n=1 Tax=Endozoicomonas atrinae TaxID=1333660 RepID=UPI003B0086B1
MINLVYVSSASRVMDEHELTALLEQSRDRNLRQNVTGMLIYCDGNFFQVLEGEEKVIAQKVLVKCRSSDLT